MFESVKKAVYERIKDDLNTKPKTKEEVNNPMKKSKKEELYNAIYCYDENNNICGYNIQLRIEQDDIYKYRFYLPIADLNWNGIKTSKELKDKKIKITFEGEYISQNELLEKNDIELAEAMYLNLNVIGVKHLDKGFYAISDSEILYLILRGFKYYGYPINEATKKENEKKKFV